MGSTCSLQRIDILTILIRCFRADHPKNWATDKKLPDAETGIAGGIAPLTIGLGINLESVIARPMILSMDQD